jgi:hypothetical protein
MIPLLRRRSAIIAALDVLPALVNPTRKRLDLVTGAFLETAHCTAAFELGWTDPEAEIAA